MWCIGYFQWLDLAELFFTEAHEIIHRRLSHVHNLVTSLNFSLCHAQKEVINIILTNRIIE